MNEAGVLPPSSSGTSMHVGQLAIFLTLSLVDKNVVRFSEDTIKFLRLQPRIRWNSARRRQTVCGYGRGYHGIEGGYDRVSADTAVDM